MTKLAKKDSTNNLRKEAEDLLKNKHSKRNQTHYEDDNLKLIHELLVHQIELELQQEELKRAKEESGYAALRYTRLFDFAPVGFFTISKEGNIVELNLMGAKMLGKERSSLIHSRFGFFVSNNTKADFNHFFENTFRTNRLETCEVALSSNGKPVVYVYLSGIVMKNENLCYLAAIDISERKLMEIDLKIAKEKAQECDRLKTAFLNNMSHEIRTPLNAIKGFSSLLVENHMDKAKLEKYSKIIDQRSNDLLEIINDLLDIAKIESGQLPIYMGNCNIDELFKELSSQFIEYKKNNSKQHIQFRLKVNCNLENLNIITDKGKLKQIFVNLITNAFKFIIKGQVTVGCNLTDNKLMFYVSDTGIGITPDQQNKCFERFVQLKHNENLSVGGTGLGLAITKELVEMLGGEIFLESEPGKGSTFSFTCPYRISNPKPKIGSVMNQSNDLIFHNKTILVVEDDTYSADYIREIISNKGSKILSASTGKKAIELVTNHSIDLVLMDIALPDIDGYEVSSQIRQIQPGIKIIVQTAYASEADRQKALEFYLNDYISKPIQTEMLLSMIKKHLIEYA